MTRRCMICGAYHDTQCPSPCPNACPECKGLGVVRVIAHIDGQFESLGIKPCPDCNGTGRNKEAK